MVILTRIYNPFEHTVEVPSLLDTHNALVAAMKYQMQKAIGILRDFLNSRKSAITLSGERLLLYAIACRFDLRDLAVAIARATLRTDVASTLFPEIENVDVSAGYLHRLLDYRRRCRAAITRIFERRDWLPGSWLQRVQNAPCAQLTIPNPMRRGMATLPPSPTTMPSSGKLMCWYEPYMKAAAASASWPSSASVTRDDVLYAGLGVKPAYSGVPTAGTSESELLQTFRCSLCMHGKGAVELFQFSQHVASTITTLEREVRFIPRELEVV
uniref:N/A n=1 Tax=Ganoderma boninense TaxID=34458 RepID=A0A5K1K7E0_9APHY|nr:N/A [Ganoderma boninense]